MILNDNFDNLNNIDKSVLCYLFLFQFLIDFDNFNFFKRFKIVLKLFLNEIFVKCFDNSEI